MTMDPIYDESGFPIGEAAPRGAPSFIERAILISTGQVPPQVTAEWLADPLFAKWLEKERQKHATPDQS